ncbi:MAG: (2Fe-2S)-binding domain protein [Clostridiales bacterium]|jgi:carbon-monoxide dehydrogenase small subunit|nr:(2Fe-2S)-binding domain protein [Clostridiales bacterium]
MNQKHILRVNINGEYLETEVDPEMCLAEFLRDQLLLTGAKIGCKKGECGACTIIMNGKAVLSCILPVMRAMDANITTIEGLSDGDKLHPLQEEFINGGAIQCGFCTSGMILSAKALIDSNPNPSHDDIKKALGGNICRCTGYEKIENSILKAAARMREVS